MPHLADDLFISLRFFSRLPVPATARERALGTAGLANAAALVPVAGAIIGLLPALVLLAASALGLPPVLAAPLAIATLALITGALHEDALSDCADGFGGGRTRERKLEIMRDSRIGSYGTCALILSFGLRWSALAAIASPWAVMLALCAAHAAARAGLPAFMSLVPPARRDGLSAGAGSPPGRSVAIAFAAGTLVLALTLGPAKALIGLVLLSLAGLILARLAIRQIGGQTGDILGAFEQAGEILILLVAAAFLHGGG